MKYFLVAEYCEDFDDGDTLAEVLDGLPRLRSLALDGGPAVLSTLLEARLDSLAKLRAVVSCYLEDFTETHSDVDRLEARLPNASVKLQLSIKGPPHLSITWGSQQ